MRRWSGALFERRLEGEAGMAKMIIPRSQKLLWLRMKRSMSRMALLMFCVAAFAQTPAQKSALSRLQPRVDGATLSEATGTVLARPAEVAFDAAGNLYIADTDDNMVLQVTPVGVLSTVAGTGEQGYSGDNGSAKSAVLDSPAGVAVDAAGNIYIADTHNNRIRKVTSGTITTIAGTGVAGFSGDGGAAASAILNLPTALAVDAAGNLYIADTNNHRIRKISGTTITTVAGNGEQLYLNDGVAATQTGLDSPSGIAVDAAGNLYIGDTFNQRLRKVTLSSGLISTIAGNGTKSFAGDGGAATSAGLATPRGVAAAADGSIYFADSDNHRIRSINGAGTISTAAGNGMQGFSGDTGPANMGMLDTPHAVAISSGTAAIADTNNQRVRAILNTNINTVAGLGNSGTAALVLSGTSPIVIGNGNLTATLLNGASKATGSVTFLDVTTGVTTLGTASLQNNIATVSLAGIAAGTHLFAATYQGDAPNPVITSGVFVVVATLPQVPNNFSIATTTATQIVLPGTTASYQFTLTPQSGTFGGGVTLTVAGLPNGATASFAPSSIAAGTSGAVSSVLTIQTPKQTASLGSLSKPISMPFALSLLSLPVFFSRRTRKKMSAIALSSRILCLLLLAGAAALSGCGSGGFFTQPQKSYSLTVTATSAAVGSSPAVSQSTTVTLTVQ
jgi:sugar lactone lactonase YvrE